MNTQNTMFRLLAPAALTVLAAATLHALPASSAAIGLAVTDGGFQVDQLRVSGNATLFEGSTIETLTAPSQIRLNGGFEMRLAAASRATIYQRKLVLEHGSGQLESPGGYVVEARSLRIAAASPETVARVRAENGRTITVAALRGVLRVTTASGVLVANIAAGKSLDFEDAGAAAPTRVSGCLLEKSGKLIVVEQTADVVLQLRGAGLENEVGNRVEITGVPENAPVSVPEASQLVRVAAFKRISKGGCVSVAKKLGATAGAGAGAGAAGGTAVSGTAGAATAGAAGGIGTGTIAVIGGVATAATVGGLAATGSLPGQSEAPPSASR